MKKFASGTSNAIQWIIAIVLGFGTVGAFSQSIISGVFMLLATICVCPFTRNVITNFNDKKLGDKSPVNKIKGWMYGVAALLFLCIGTSSAAMKEPAHEESVQNIVQTENFEESEAILETIAEERPGENLKTPTPSPMATPTPTPTSTPTPTPTSTPIPEPIVETIPVSTSEPVISQEESTGKGIYAVNGKNGKIHIVGDCSATGTGENAMDNPVYFDTFEEAEAYSATIESKPERRKCGNCWK